MPETETKIRIVAAVVAVVVVVVVIVNVAKKPLFLRRTLYLMLVISNIMRFECLLNINARILIVQLHYSDWEPFELMRER